MSEEPSPSSNQTQNQNSQSTRTVKHFECRKGVIRVSTLTIQPKEIENGKKLGTLPCSLSAMLGEKHLELTVILDTKGISRVNKNGSRWFGFYFCGTVNNLEKCFQKKYQNLQTIFRLIENSFVNPNPEPYFCPLIVIGDVTGGNEGPGNSNQAFWQVRNEDQSKVVGYVPLFHRSDVFHTLPDYPLISFERNPLVNDSIGMSVVICTNVDRNSIFNSNQFLNSNELDQSYSSSLQKISSFLRPEKWRIQVCNSEKANSSFDNLLKDSFDVLNAKKPNDWNYVEGLVFSKKTITKEVDLIALSISASGRTHFSQAVQRFYVNGEETKEKKEGITEFYEKKGEELTNEVKSLQSISIKGVTIYNPFLAKECGIPSIISNSNQIPLQIHLRNQRKSQLNSNSKPSEELNKSSEESFDQLSNLSLNESSNPVSSLPHLLGLIQNSNSSSSSLPSPSPHVSSQAKGNLVDPSILVSGKVISQPAGEGGLPPPVPSNAGMNPNQVSILDQLQTQLQGGRNPVQQLDRQKLATAMARCFLNYRPQK